MRINYQQLSLKRIYIFWAILLMATMVIYKYSGRYHEIMTQAVLKAESAMPSKIPQESMVAGFIVISILVALVTIGIGFFLVTLASKGRKWAQWFFLLFCLWQIKDSTWGIYEISQMYPKLSSTFYEIVISLLSLCLMGLLTVKTVLLIKEQK